MRTVRNLIAGAALLAAPAMSHAVGLFVSVNIAPPALPVYVQPPLPAEGYIWTPGYWAYGPDGYYWVPGVWVQPPTVGLLWTPGYWGFAGGVYGWHAGYWGPHVGFYGGVNYGFGYGGIGFVGGEWRGGHFAYNSAVANFGGVHVTNVYVNREVVVHNTIVNNNHVSFNGGAGIQAHASPAEMQAEHEQHVQPTANQMSHESAASRDRSQLASVNHGRPATPAASNVNAYHAVAQQHAAQPVNARPAGQQGRPNAENRPAQTAEQHPNNVNRPAQQTNHAESRPAPAHNNPRPAPENKKPEPERRER